MVALHTSNVTERDLSESAEVLYMFQALHKDCAVMEPRVRSFLFAYGTWLLSFLCMSISINTLSCVFILSERFVI
jgi:hypothetical protein